MMAILCLFDLESDKLRFLAVPGRNESALHCREYSAGDNTHVGRTIEKSVVHYSSVVQPSRML